MRVKYREGLLFTTVTLTHGGHTLAVSDVIVDTGAAQSLISTDAVDEIFQRYEPSDKLVTLGGIGGDAVSVRRKIDLVQLDDFSARDFFIDFASMAMHPGINGLLGMDILTAGRYTIDLGDMRVWRDTDR
ncbi:retropepsin-like domain-containing protein [Alicyclobacillus cycloheptanicus]|uniref:Peptidase A2 domain-containing protein n=1 Tax=Alicyclobacillus cycloheptanicus TaxID=1457 RepID=A0ABT9XMP8_9BACL|nr:retropepsin-like aspartic protease [Alicyclobacillus cycloheptanicus]MDQ0191591.1 hypothetical protein [Alicyclobacillus cycloheptanicus]WDM02238.1 retropepsin-like domain-containing protein [Alicyclobacillus cycloheptanicus]